VKHLNRSTPKATIYPYRGSGWKIFLCRLPYWWTSEIIFVVKTGAV